MLLSIEHLTELTYTDRVSESVNEIRMAPRTDNRQTLRGFGLALGPPAQVSEHIDWLGNRVHQFSVLESHDKLIAVAHSAVETHGREVKLDEIPDETVTSGELTLEMYDFLAFAGPITKSDALAELLKALGLEREPSTARVVSGVAKSLREKLEYKKGVTTHTSTVNEVLERGAGVCQDLAHVAIGLLRLRGIPARYVSGYLHRADGPAELETHAWCEAYVPAVGWVAVDPTHATTADERHITVAVGRSYADVPPNRGVFHGDAEEAIRVRVTISEVDEVPKGLLSPRPAVIDVPIYSRTGGVHREAINYQQEQQQQ